MRPLCLEGSAAHTSTQELSLPCWLDNIIYILHWHSSVQRIGSKQCIIVAALHAKMYQLQVA